MDPVELVDKEALNILKSKYNQNNIIPYKGSILNISLSANMDISGKLSLNTNAFVENGRTTILRLDKDSKLKVDGEFRVFYGGDIICFSGGQLILGSGFINSNVIVRCNKKIEIGNNVAISHNVTIMDFDGHKIIRDGYEMSAPIKIGDHVWIGTGVKILKGVTIGDGAIIGAGAIVTEDIPPYTLAVGIPAKVIKENVKWE